MCQWGAYGQSRKGKKAEDILGYYYPGAAIVTIDKVKSRP
jgi:peptidoglycan hydrolase-like amidase